MKADDNEIQIRKSQNDIYKLEEASLKERFKNLFKDSIYDKFKDEIEEMSQLAWQAYQDNHKSPFTKKAGAEFKNPDYDLSVDWLEARDRIRKAQKEHDEASEPNILVISGAARNDMTCPGELSKSRRLVETAKEALLESGAKVEVLDMSEQISDFGKTIYPCKACVSTAMPLCHWPCSCYPNHATLQINDWMNDIYPMWVRAHGIMIVTPVYWYQAPSALKVMIDRLVCADGGNPDPSSTKGKDPKLAKQLEVAGWNYPRHLEGRLFSVVVHGDTQGADPVRMALTSWLKDIHLIPAGINADIARYIGYYEPYATSHAALDRDEAMMNEARICAQSLAIAAKAAIEKKLDALLPHFEESRPK